MNACTGGERAAEVDRADGDGGHDGPGGGEEEEEGAADFSRLHWRWRGDCSRRGDGGRSGGGGRLLSMPPPMPVGAFLSPRHSCTIFFPPLLFSRVLLLLHRCVYLGRD